MSRATTGGRRALVVVAALTTLLLAACTTGADQKSAVPPSTTRAPATPSTAAGGPLAPTTGSYVGAWVAPPDGDYTVEGRERAVTDFESMIGRPLTIVHTYTKWDKPFPDEVDEWAADSNRTVLLSWAGADTRSIQAGTYDDLIRQRARDIKNWGKPVLLEWRWEMDRPNLQASIWSPTDYINAWTHIQSIFAAEDVTNVSWVWCPLATGFDNNRAQPFYPGDAHVDWICADAYPSHQGESLAEVLGPFLSWAKGHDKPIILGEYGDEADDPDRAAWLTAAAATIKANPQIKAAVYFDQTSTTPPVYDLGLNDAPSQNAFRAMAKAPYFRPPLQLPEP